MKPTQPLRQQAVSCSKHNNLKFIFFLLYEKGATRNLLLASALLFFFSFNASAQQSTPAEGAQPTGKVEQKIVDNGYFKYTVTGDAETDAESYRKAKEEFVKNQPEQYEKMIKEEAVPQKHVIDGKEFEQMPVEKRNHILANPDVYTIGKPD